MFDPSKIQAADNRGIKAKRFVSIGECMVEMAPSTQADGFKLGFAGDTFNTAWYVKSLAPQWTSRFVSRVGQDKVSDDMVAMMTAAGIETNHVLRSSERSVGLYLNSLQNGERSFSYWRDRSAARQLADDRDALENAVSDADLVYFSGITMAILDAAGREAFLDTMRKARAAGKTCVFDSNLRPRLWESPEVMRDAIMRAAAVSNIVLPSFDDEAVHFEDGDIAATRDRYLAAGATTVIVKNGKDAVHFAHNGKTGHIAPEVAPAVVDTTSAGDSFNAGVLVVLGNSGSIEEAIATGSNVAGHVISHKGALVDLPRHLLAQTGART